MFNRKCKTPLAPILFSSSKFISSKIFLAVCCCLRLRQVSSSSWFLLLKTHPSFFDLSDQKKRLDKKRPANKFPPAIRTTTGVKTTILPDMYFFNISSACFKSSLLCLNPTFYPFFTDQPFHTSPIARFK